MSAKTPDPENKAYQQRLREEAAQQQVQRQADQRELHGIKAKLQQDRQEHTFEVEWYGRELPFNPLPKEASDALDGKRTRLMHCIQNGNLEEFAEQTDKLTENAAEWLAESWDGPEPMDAQDWRDLYDADELLELVNLVDNKGGGVEEEAIVNLLNRS